MPLKAPSILRNWQELPHEATQPTCYDQRNPVMPWLPATELGFEDADDRETAQAWLAGDAPASSIGAMQSRTSSGKAREAAERAQAARQAESSTKTILQQLEQALAPYPKKST